MSDQIEEKLIRANAVCDECYHFVAAHKTGPCRAMVKVEAAGCLRYGPRPHQDIAPLILVGASGPAGIADPDHINTAVEKAMHGNIEKLLKAPVSAPSLHLDRLDGLGVPRPALVRHATDDPTHVGRGHRQGVGCCRASWPNSADIRPPVGDAHRPVGIGDHPVQGRFPASRLARRTPQCRQKPQWRVQRRSFGPGRGSVPSSQPTALSPVRGPQPRHGPHELSVVADRAAANTSKFRRHLIPPR
jgi:hypothetical protein